MRRQIVPGGTIVLKERSKGSLTIKFFVDDKQICKKHLNDDTLTLKWELNSPLWGSRLISKDALIDLEPGSILKSGSRLVIQLGERKSYRVTRKVRAEASASFDDCQRLLSSSPVQLKGLCNLRVAAPILCWLTIAQSSSSTTIQQSPLTSSHKYVSNRPCPYYRMLILIAIIRTLAFSRQFWIETSRYLNKPSLSLTVSGRQGSFWRQ